MALVAGAAVLYILSLVVLSEKGQDVRKIFTDVNRVLSNRKGADFMYKLKVNEENRVIAAVNVTHVCILEHILEDVYPIAAIETTNDPVITYEEIAQELGIPVELNKPAYKSQKSENLFFMETFIEYPGNTTDEFAAVLKESVTNTLKQKRAGILFVQTYKHLAARKLSDIITAADIPELDRQISNLTFSANFGSNVHRRVKGVQFLDYYVARRQTGDGCY